MFFKESFWVGSIRKDREVASGITLNFTLEIHSSLKMEISPNYIWENGSSELI